MKRSFLFVLISLLFAGTSFALTWDQVSIIAHEKSNVIKSAQKQLDASKWTYLRTYSAYLPQISANLSESRSLNASGNSNSYSYGISATQTLFKGFSNYFNLQSSYLGFQFDDAGLKKAESDFNYDLRSAFVDLLTAQENIAVQAKILKSRKENARMIKLMYDSGKEDRGNYLRTQSQAKDAEYGLASAKRELDLAKYKLSQFLGSDVSSVEGDFNVQIDKEINIDPLAKSSPSYLMSKYLLDLASIDKTATIGEFLPSINLSGNYQRSGTEWPPAQSSKSVTLSMSYSLFPGGSNIADALINNFKYDKAREDFEKAVKDLSFGIKDAYLNMQDAVEAYGVQRSYLNAAIERSKIAQSKYLNGLIGYLEWDQIQNEYISYQRNLNSYKKAMLLAQASFYKSFGGVVK